MKFIVLLVCSLAMVMADEEQNQEKKTQTPDNTQSPTVGLQQPTGSLLNTQLFPPNFNVFGTKDTVSGVPYTGFNSGNLSPIQNINPDLFAAAPAVVNGAISTFPVTRTILPGASAVVSGLQTAFPVASGVLSNIPAVNALGNQFQSAANGILSTVAGIPGVTGGSLGTNNPVANGALPSVSSPFRVLSPEGLSGISPQGFQAHQGIVPGSLSSIPAFTGGILPPITNGVVPTGQSGVLKNPQKVQF